ncbi:group II truncated hemoglobin [Polyangium aurulentum]|uniref:group II truncated hemoglobin n=1 Tax=Polyangium aurulentum TaxID=2567896 RepID=UPI0010AE4814|nr:group II truncated hemoglobin [Polyangium aurulentum]UQA60861.1 group II truncated hemoglobin [Polyangium aurulentum]
MPETSATPYELLGGEAAVRQLSERFYDAMDRDEPALARLHPLDEHGRVARESRDRFALFLIGWLGGPQDYIAAHGHPRLRMRHARVPVDISMRDAWMRAMRTAMDEVGVPGELRAFLEVRFAEVADFMRNRPG